jgi:hypothetical protein
MTNAQPEDINIKLAEMDDRLEQLGDEIDLIRTIQNANRRETRANSQTIGRIERTVSELVDIARLHQQALRMNQENIAQVDRTTSELVDIARLHQQALKMNQENINRIWQYLESQIRTNGNGNAG